MKTRLAVSAIVLVLGITIAPAAAVAHPALAPLPKRFPRPPHSSILKEHFKGRNHDYELNVTSTTDALRFWKHELPKHGWTIKRAHLKGPLKFILFKGHGDGAGKNTGEAINTTEINTLSPHSHHLVVVFHKLK